MTAAYQPTEKYLEIFPDSCARWRIASDAMRAHNSVTGATLTFQGVDKDGPVFLTNYKYVHSQPGDDLKPLLFRYDDPELSFEFRVLRQIALSYWERDGTVTRFLLWKLDMDKIQFQRKAGEGVQSLRLEESHFNALRDDLVAILFIWPDQPDEIGKIDKDAGRVKEGLPYHDVIVTGGWLSGQWAPRLFRWSDGIKGLFSRGGYPTRKVREFHVRSRAWVFKEGTNPQLVHSESGAVLRYDSEIRISHFKYPHLMPHDKCRQFTLIAGDMEMPLWVECDYFSSPPHSDWDSDWHISMRDTAVLKSGQSLTGVRELHSMDFYRKHLTPQEAFLIETVAVEGFLHWPGLPETGHIPPALVRTSGGYLNGCRNYRAVFDTGHDVSLYALFEFTDWKKHWTDL